MVRELLGSTKSRIEEKREPSAGGRSRLTNDTKRKLKRERHRVSPLRSAPKDPRSIALGARYGVAYRVIEVDGKPLPTIDDFVGQVAFDVEVAGLSQHLSGWGSRDGIGVRVCLQQHHGTAEPTQWRLCGVPGTGFMAEMLDPNRIHSHSDDSAFPVQ